MGLTVAVTGPTGDIGRAAIRELERHDEIERIVGMARRPFDPSEHGWRRTEYVRGDILDRSSVERLVADADVVVHLAFIIFGNHEETQKVNLEGSRNVFEEAVEAGAKRLVYTSSVAAYGFHPENPQPLTEDVEPRGSEELYYSAQKAELEGVLRECLAGSTTDAYVFRPCVVAGADAPAVVKELGADGLGGPLRRVMEAVPLVPPILPVPRFPLQLVHHDDVARAIAAAVLGKGSPGLYNLAAPDTITLAELGEAMGWRALPIPRLAVSAAASTLSRVPLLPARVQWLKAATTPVIMDCSKARDELGWEPRFDTAETLRDTLQGVEA